MIVAPYTIGCPEKTLLSQILKAQGLNDRTSKNYETFFLVNSTWGDLEGAASPQSWEEPKYFMGQKDLYRVDLRDIWVQETDPEALGLFSMNFGDFIGHLWIFFHRLFLKSSV